MIPGFRVGSESFPPRKPAVLQRGHAGGDNKESSPPAQSCNVSSSSRDIIVVSPGSDSLGTPSKKAAHESDM